MIKIVNSNIVTAFNEKAIGSKVLDRDAFMYLVTKAVEQHDFSKDMTPGQGMLDLTHAAALTVLRSCVSSGIGRKTDDPADYVLRFYRGSPHMFLRRQRAEGINTLRVLVYTKDAYLNDPDVINEPSEGKRIHDSDCTHVLVGIFADSVKSFVSPFRFVANLAGGNRDCETMDKTALVELARNVKEYAETWTTVAD